MQTTEEEESKQTKEDEAEETKQEEKLIQTEASIIIVSDSDDSDTEAYDSNTEDILVPEVLMNLTVDSCDSDTENMPTPELPTSFIFE